MTKITIEDTFETVESDLPSSDEILSVAQLNQYAKGLLETSFPSVWVTGEVSNFIQPQSGHAYFSLKDERAQIRCALFRHRLMGLNVKPTNGMQVLVNARVSLYAPRGDYQLIVEYLEEAGVGQLKRRFEQLKQLLAQEGLFEAQYKKPIPAFPKAIGVVTSPTGAAIRDILHVLKRRFPSLPVFIYPTLVQGEQAAPQIVAAIELAQQHGLCDVLIVARGGGSIEDLWPFNEEIVARAIFKCTIPIITGVGHEIDFTIADFVADCRAPTPSAAAELASPRWDEWYQFFQKSAQQLSQILLQQLSNQQRLLAVLQQHIKQPAQQLAEYYQTLDHWVQRLSFYWSQYHSRHIRHLHQLQEQLWQQHPQKHLIDVRHRIQHLAQQLTHQIHFMLQTKQHQWVSFSKQLNAFNPLATLQRGYTMTYDIESGNVLTHCADLKRDQTLKIQFQDGACDVVVTEILSR